MVALLAAVFVLFILSLPDGKLHIIACDVGQGDAILITYKTTQIVTDGGLPNGKLESCLTRHVPFWDREIELIVNTHPQLDHYGGLIGVLQKYKVDNFVANALDSISPEYQVLKTLVGSKGIRVINPQRGMKFRSGLISYYTFWPTVEFLLSEGKSSKINNKLGEFTSTRDPNDFSVQAILTFSNFDALLTGDIGSNISELVLPNVPQKNIDYIKIPHHGSKNGLTSSYLKLFQPKLAVISLGEKNTYGHPHKEILDLLNSAGVKYYRTDLSGDIEVISDGEKFWVSTQK